MGLWYRHDAGASDVWGAILVHILSLGLTVCLGRLHVAQIWR